MRRQPESQRPSVLERCRFLLETLHVTEYSSPSSAGRGRLVTVGILVSLAFPIAVWWAIGSMGQGGSFFIKPPQIQPVVGHAVGAMAALIVVAGLVVLGLATRRGQIRPEWCWDVLAPILFAGLIVGAGGRVVTASVDGANIGAGLVLLVGPPLVLIMIVIAVVRTISLLRQGRRTRVQLSSK